MQNSSQEPEYPPPADEPPPDHNPEALEDIERGSFLNVDLASPTKPPVPPPPSQGQSVNTSTVSKSVILGSVTSPFAAMNFNDQIALLGVFSLVVLIQSSVNCAEGDYVCTEVNGFAVASGTISLAICLAYFFLQARGQAEEIHKFYLSVFLFLWWAASMIALTFFGPFVGTTFANGYFGTWGGFIMATLMLSNTSEVFRKGIDRITNGVSRKPLLYLLVSSIIEVGSSIKTCIPQSECSGLNAFAIALGTISAILCLILIPLVNRLSTDQSRKVAMFFCIWWVVGGMIVTFIAPFQNLGNGYFSVFAAIISSFYLLESNETATEVVV